MPRVGLVLDVRRIDRDTALLLLGSLVDLGVVDELAAALLCKDFRDGGGKSCLSVVDMPNCPNVHMGLGTRKLASRVGVTASRSLGGVGSEAIQLRIDVTYHF